MNKIAVSIFLATIVMSVACDDDNADVIIIDTDNDGIADAWEAAHGLNAKDSADGSAMNAKSGYTNLEDYLNSLAAAKG